jgi:hypothetical protein
MLVKPAVADQAGFDRAGPLIDILVEVVWSFGHPNIERERGS